MMDYDYGVVDGFLFGIGGEDERRGC